MKRSMTILALVGVAGLTVSVGSATANDRHNREEVVRAFLVGANETPAAVLTKATGRFRAVIDEDSQIINFTLSYSGLEGGNTLFAHIHAGQRHTTGGVMVFLCGGGTKPTACPGPSGEVTGSIIASDVQAIATQQVPAGSFDELLTALRSNLAYVNVHTTASPGGEIRGQISR
jgi:hypothetical protein